MRNKRRVIAYGVNHELMRPAPIARVAAKTGVVTKHQELIFTKNCGAERIRGKQWALNQWTVGLCLLQWLQPTRLVIQVTINPKIPYGNLTTQFEADALAF